MNTKVKNIVAVVLMATVIGVLSLLCYFAPKADFLDTERRAPEAFPELSLTTVMKDGTEYEDSFMSNFEGYALDAFPFRDFFRTVKAISANYVFRQLDNNNIFVAEGYAAALQPEMDAGSVTHAANRMTFIYEKFLKDKGITPHLAIIPDKAYFLAEDNGRLNMDYDAFVAAVKEGVPFAEYIDLFPTLSIEDYYKTDTHWRQEKLTDTAAALVEGMGGVYTGSFTPKLLDNPFYGVYYGQAALPMPAEDMYYMQSDALKNVTVFDFQNNKEISLYDMEKAHGRDPYDMYLSGELSLVTIENPDATTDKELIVFRDSFGRAIVPLMAQDYAKITIVDIRYLASTMLGGLIQFKDQDVLFLYSTLVLNASSEMR